MSFTGNQAKNREAYRRLERLRWIALRGGGWYGTPRYWTVTPVLGGMVRADLEQSGATLYVALRRARVAVRRARMRSWRRPKPGLPPAGPAGGG